jgi:hypothetical protein
MRTVIMLHRTLTLKPGTADAATYHRQAPWGLAGHPHWGTSLARAGHLHQSINQDRQEGMCQNLKRQVPSTPSTLVSYTTSPSVKRATNLL